MADGRFGCEADMAGPAAGSTRSLVTGCAIAVQELRIAIGPWDPISLVAISSADDMSWMLKTAESRAWGRHCGDAISSKRLAPACA